MFESILVRAPVFLLVFIRCFTFITTIPLFSMRATTRIAKIALAGYLAFFVFGQVQYDEYIPFLTDDGTATLKYILLAVGEGLIGIILGFYVTIIFSAFSTAGQFTAFQMGLSAASSYDSLSQVENPLMGQFFNFMAMLIFLQTKWFQTIFMNGFLSSFKAMNAVTLILHQNDFIKFLFTGLSKLFADAMVISLPIMGTLMMITICTGLLSKAAPQMNLLSEGFPIMILVGYGIILVALPSIMNFFEKSFYEGFLMLEKLFTDLSNGGIS